MKVRESCAPALPRLRARLISALAQLRCPAAKDPKRTPATEDAFWCREVRLLASLCASSLS